MYANATSGGATAAAAVATAVASNASKMMDKPLALSLCDLLGLVVIFSSWPILLPLTSRYVLNHYRALKLYDAQEPNVSLALAASAAQKKLSWWKRHQSNGPKGWWLAALVHKLHLLLALVTYFMLIVTLSEEGEPTFPTWLNKRLPDMFIISLFWHMSLQPFLRLRLTEVPVEERRAPQLISVFLKLARFRVFFALDLLTLGNPDACSVAVSRPSANGTWNPVCRPMLCANQLDRAEFLGRFTANAVFLAPFAFILYKIRSMAGSAAFSEGAGSGLLALAVPIVFTMAPWSAANIPMSVRGKASLLSQCAFPYIIAAIVTVILVCTDKNGFWGSAIREGMKQSTFFTASPEKFNSAHGSSASLSKEAVETLLNLVNLSLPLFALLGCGAYHSLIGIITRVEAKSQGLDYPTEAQIEAQRKKNETADAQNLPTDVHGRRPVALAEAQLTQEELRLWVGKVPIAVFTACITVFVHSLLVQFMLPLVGDMGRDDYIQRFDLARKMWRIFFLTPFVAVPVFATLTALFLGGFTSAKQLWSYTEQWGVDEQEKRRLKDLALRRKMLAAAGKSGSYASAIDTKEGAEVEALLIAEKA